MLICSVLHNATPPRLPYSQTKVGHSHVSQSAISFFCLWAASFTRTLTNRGVFAAFENPRWRLLFLTNEDDAGCDGDDQGDFSLWSCIECFFVFPRNPPPLRSHRYIERHTDKDVARRINIDIDRHECGARHTDASSRGHIHTNASTVEGR